jgi:TolB-like protein/DNA-binding winged helix-turn-helix (wHTH) protein
MSAFEHDTIRFDAVEIDLGGRRLLIAGTERPLEPKAFSVLALLAQHPGRAFTRDEILDAVWGHRHVTPGVLNRAITLIRHALGESGDVHRYLRTLHGVGYRFDAMVHNGEALSAVVDATSDELQPLALAIPADVTSSNAIAPMAAPALPAIVIKPAITTALSTSRQRVRSIHWLLGVLAAVVLTAALAWLPRQSAAPSAATQPTLVVLPLRAVGGVSDENLLAGGLSEELITRLARTEGLRLISQTSAALAQTNKLDLNQLAQQLHVTHALEGSLRQSGQQLRIDLRLIDVPGGRTLWAQDYDRNIADVFAIESDIAQAVAAALTLRLSNAPNARAVNAADTDPSLLRRVLEARTVLRDPAAHPDKSPETILRALLGEHPDYAPAHGLLALVLSLRHSVGDARWRDEVQREAERAIQLDANLPEPYVALSRCANQVTDWDRAVAMYQKALQLTPTDSVYRSTYGYVLAGLGYIDEGLRQAEIGAASDPLNAVALVAQARMLDTVGRHDEAKKFIDALLSVTPSSGAYAGWMNAAWRHDSAGMRAAQDAMWPGDNIWKDSYVAATAALEDPRRWPEAHVAIEESERRARAQHASNTVNFIRLLDPRSDYAAFFADLDMSLRSTYPTYHLMIWMPEYRAARQTPEFQDFLKRNRIIDYWRAHGFPPQCKPAGDGARCD